MRLPQQVEHRARRALFGLHAGAIQKIYGLFPALLILSNQFVELQ